ncbi:bifunctional tRNA (5-methylaminomethyl-2-thiouridine)(34)-methyltransferase MnmD/FAD-dependent 5-carboxymethylaminomethyl-2-thiouridine(34) oxidoreductase MnmC [Paludibacterium yongneupense]|uniref:bifunctional tRNA (5-methylaminomethyl-2-thiouridine)(34)-methyltransferase MnmD/FAD-dependent 5-carboxymethylaminomethyl-2-thiouridine(34) oxidoreductase MnmC n=1 Tax=Paludibacterium yongneupense TaxID=400061 RepID=UPI00041F9003|nr:bifunctional tRNA (5-methylaminomethyl-2-thiouridine)(34)-methyltransferase MnmD/FAD-dependent 5-carboxymethylaminomethyl-2-thiouridine(34) oxidoreductase MnmC [Paludibacterium yongneupense]
MTHTARLDWQDGQPYSSRYEDIYFSRDSGLDETRHVFLHHNALPERFAALSNDSHFVIAETGFGTGLNFLCAWQCFLEHAPPGARLHFVSTERFALAADDLEQALALWPQLADLGKQLLCQYPLLTPGWHRMNFAETRITLTLLVGDALETLPRLEARVDAWFLDGFSPAKNPDMWQPALFQTMARLSAPGATFATFTSAGFVRRGLSAVGFRVEKVPGFANKREMSRGVLERIPDPEWQAPWYQHPRSHLKERSAIVIGGGIAGAASAYSLARRGWQVTLLERHDALASEASGNPQGMLYTKLSPHFTSLTRLALAGYAYTLTLAETLFGDDPDAWQACGVLQLSESGDERQAALAACGLPADMLHPVDATEAGRIAGIALERGGLFFPRGGWVHPPTLVAALCSHRNIRVITAATALELAYDPSEGQWLAFGENGPLAVGAVTILAAAADCSSFDATSHLPLNRIRGQISEVPATAQSGALKTVVCGEGYVAPARAGRHCMGATFKFNSEQNGTTVEEHRENLAMLGGLSPALFGALNGAGLDPERIDGRAAFRCVSPDTLPLVGPVTDAAAFRHAYRALSRDATLRMDTPSPWVHGLYVNTAHGSRGMITAPLAGEILAAMLENEPGILDRPLLDALHPSRFLLRELIRSTPR